MASTGAKLQPDRRSGERWWCSQLVTISSPGAGGGQTVNMENISAGGACIAVDRPFDAGDRLRIWVLDAGPNRDSAFHVVGAQFDTVYREGHYELRPGDPGGSQALDLSPASGGFVETVFPEPGHYSFLSHIMVDADRGARGSITVQ